MTQVRERPAVQPGPGMTAVRLHLFDEPGEELARALKPPWPRWMRRLYELEESSNEAIDTGHAEVTASAATSAVSEALRHRLDLVAFVAAVLEGLGWEIELRGNDLVATARMTPYEARRVLEDEGVAGPMCAVCDMDEAGWPRMWYGGDA